MAQWDDKMHIFDETTSLQAVQNIVLPIITLSC